MSNVPIWAEPAPGSRKPRFTREQIAAAALAIADREGFEALSMRRIAEALGAGTMTLYYYIRTKDDLLALMDDALMGEIVAQSQPLPAAWRPAIELIARATHNAFVRHRWALRELHGMRLVGPNALRHFEHSLQAVARLPLAQPAQLELIAVVDDFVFGSALRQSLAAPVDAKTAAVINATAKAALAAGDYPRVVAMIAGREPMDVFDTADAVRLDAERFERGLAMLLDGFSAAHGLRVTRPAAPRRRRRRSR